MSFSQLIDFHGGKKTDCKPNMEGKIFLKDFKRLSLCFTFSSYQAKSSVDTNHWSSILINKASSEIGLPLPLQILPTARVHVFSFVRSPFSNSALRESSENPFEYNSGYFSGFVFAHRIPTFKAARLSGKEEKKLLL